MPVNAIAIITAPRSEGVAVRARELQISYLYQGAEHKLGAFAKLPQANRPQVRGI
ncbi:MAG: hypothetical protein E5299_00720 [Burkholderia gladioli]|nr:MAG: hypothetical protein E5299_00720 [Burkholderia gladioli]